MLIREILKTSGLPALETELLLAHVLQRPRAWLMAHDDIALEKSEIEIFQSLSSRRKCGEPLAYITGKKEFYGRTFFVTKDVLIPRSATEEFVACALKFMQSPAFIETEIDTQITALCVPLAAGTARMILDVGTGSGCIAATLALEGRKEKILAIDTSEDAITIAQENFKELSLDIPTAVGDGAAFIRAVHQPFFIISNPPYIPEGTVLQNDVEEHEPHEALFAGTDGMDVLTRLAHAATENPHCLGIMLELRTEQAVIIKRLLGVM